MVCFLINVLSILYYMVENNKEYLYLPPYQILASDVEPTTYLGILC